MHNPLRRNRPLNPDKPNIMEITGTNIPLLATVLAGFAVTIVIELIDQNKCYKNIQWISTKTGLSFIAISIPIFLSSAIYSTYGQSYNYLILTKDVKDLMRFDDEHSYGNYRNIIWQKYLNTNHTIWQYWHSSSITLYYIGITTFVFGVNILLLIYIGTFVVSVVLLIIFFSVYYGFLLEKISDEIRK